MSSWEVALSSLVKCPQLTEEELSPYLLFEIDHVI